LAWLLHASRHERVPLMRRTLQSVVLGQAWLLAVPALLPLSGLARLPWPGLLTLTLAAATLCLAGLRLLWLHRVGLTAERDAARARLKEREAQLVQSQKTEAVGRLACGIAHDFNNLLTAITGYTEMALLYPHLEKSVRGALEEIQSSAERAAGLTHRLLAFSRRQAVEPAALSLNVLIEDFRRMLRPIIGENIRLITELDPELGLLEADRGRMEQVLLNLVVNAREAMPDGGSLRIATRNAAAGRSPLGERPGVLLEIADSGLGMDAHTQSRMFEPFFTTKPDGTGLGLATVWEIVQGSGGHIAVESGPGRGTTFRLCFPRVHDAGRRQPAAAPPAGLPEGSGTILVVEDEEQVRRMIVQTLRCSGYRVLEAPGGREALRLLARGAQEPLDLILTDVIMPDMSGDQLAERLPAAHRGVPVLYMSGYTGHQRLEPAGLLHKPFSPQALCLRIREHLQLARGEPELASHERGT
jgi:two-component system cell cycle sensor histidine kinase/response regulator CckA